MAVTLRLSVLIVLGLVLCLAALAQAPREMGRANLAFKTWYGLLPTEIIDGGDMFSTPAFDAPELRQHFPDDWVFKPTTHAMKNNPDLRNYFDPHFVVTACAPEGCETGRRAIVTTWVSSLFRGTYYVHRLCEADRDVGGATWWQHPVDPELANSRRKPHDGVWWPDPLKITEVRSDSFECPSDAKSLVTELYNAYWFGDESP